MNKKSLFFILFLLFFSQIIGQIYANLPIPNDTYRKTEFSKIFDHFSIDCSYKEKQRNITYTVDNSGDIKTKTIIEKDIIIGNTTGLMPVINNLQPDKLKATARLENIYLLTTEFDTKQKECINLLVSYYNALPFTGPYNLTDKEMVIDKILLPITKDNIIKYLSSKNIKNANDCFKALVNSKTLIEYPILLITESQIIGTQKDLGDNYKFIIKFDPEFMNPVKPITYSIKFRKDPVEIKSIYSLPNNDCKTNLNSNFCYITIKDIENYNLPQYTSPLVNQINTSISLMLDNFNVVSGFKNSSFENIKVKDLLVNLALKRERFCFREENNEYTETIFRVAKAYDLSLEQTFQLWAIISERSNCNYQVNPNRYGFAQIDLKNRDTGNLIDIDKIEYPVSDSTDICSKNCPGYKVSKNYPKKGLTFNGKTFKKEELCYACNSKQTLASRCDPSSGFKSAYSVDLSQYHDLKSEICDNDSIASTNNPKDSKLPLQMAEEEQFQYLALGDFKEINEYLLNYKYKGDHSQFYNYGSDGKINTNYTYFSFLINAIKHNKDDYGSTILFTSDYLKELNYLIKNSRDKSSNPYAFDNFIVTKSSNLNNLYILSSLMGGEDISKINQTHLLGDYPELFNVDSFFLKENNYIKTTKEIRVLINYLAIKRKYFENPNYFSKLGLSDIQSNSKELETKISTYEKLDHKYWLTKKNTYLETLNKNNWELLLKNSDYNNYEKLLAIEGKPNYPTTYVTNFGQTVYSDGKKYYPNMRTLAWDFDTKKEAIDNYTLIWEAADICSGKIVCSENDSRTQNCCKENKAVQDGKTSFSYLDVIIDGALLGIYNPTSKYNDDNREYTHLAMYIGKTIEGVPLIAENTSTKPKIAILTKEIRNRIKRIYVPKSTNITNIKDVINLQQKYPQTYLKITQKNMQELNSLETQRKGKTDYYEDPNLEGEGDLESPIAINGKCSIYLQEDLDKYIYCLRENLTMVALNKTYSINATDNNRKISISGLGTNLISVKYNRDSLVCKDREEFNKVIFSVAKKANLTEEETAQLWSRLAAESGCNLNCGIGCHGDGIGQVVVSTWRSGYSTLKQFLVNIDSQKYSSSSKYQTILNGQDKDPVSATEISYAVNKYIIISLIELSKNSKKPITAEIFEIYDNDNAINGMFITSYNYCRTNPGLFKNGLTPPQYFSGCVYTSLHKMGYYLAYKRMIYDCYNGNATNSFVNAYKTIYGGTLCE